MFSDDEKALTKALIEHALSDTRGPRRWHVTRVYMYRALENLLREHVKESGQRCLSVSHSDALAKVLGLSPVEMIQADFPEADLRSLKFEDESFDFVIADQVLEHVEGDPIAAFAESVRVLRPGGFVAHTTC